MTNKLIKVHIFILKKNCFIFRAPVHFHLVHPVVQDAIIPWANRLKLKYCWKFYFLIHSFAAMWKLRFRLWKMRQKLLSSLRSKPTRTFSTVHAQTWSGQVPIMRIWKNKSKNSSEMSSISNYQQLAPRPAENNTTDKMIWKKMTWIWTLAKWNFRAYIKCSLIK